MKRAPRAPILGGNNDGVCIRLRSRSERALGGSDKHPQRYEPVPEEGARPQEYRAVWPGGRPIDPRQRSDAPTGLFHAYGELPMDLATGLRAVEHTARPQFARARDILRSPGPPREDRRVAPTANYALVAWG
jgi:hypothetical protein